jgi:hypothetical protein
MRGGPVGRARPSAPRPAPASAARRSERAIGSAAAAAAGCWTIRRCSSRARSRTATRTLMLPWMRIRTWVASVPRATTFALLPSSLSSRCRASASSRLRGLRSETLAPCSRARGLRPDTPGTLLKGARSQAWHPGRLHGPRPASCRAAPPSAHDPGQPCVAGSHSPTAHRRRPSRSLAVLAEPHGAGVIARYHLLSSVIARRLT